MIGLGFRVLGFRDSVCEVSTMEIVFPNPVRDDTQVLLFSCRIGAMLRIDLLPRRTNSAD